MSSGGERQVAGRRTQVDGYGRDKEDQRRSGEATLRMIAFGALDTANPSLQPAQVPWEEGGMIR